MPSRDDRSLSPVAGDARLDRWYNSWFREFEGIGAAVRIRVLHGPSNSAACVGALRRNGPALVRREAGARSLLDELRADGHFTEAFGTVFPFPGLDRFRTFLNQASLRIEHRL